jgi:hypothetical protein
MYVLLDCRRETDHNICCLVFIDLKLTHDPIQTKIYPLSIRLHHDKNLIVKLEAS